jgi:Tfp pilus assembly protein PilZ
MDAHKHLKSRKDARLFFNKNQKVAVRCLTDRCNFDARIKNVSSSGVFIQTDQQLPIGEEIAVSFTFPDSGNQVNATGKVVRITHSGMGVEIQVYFKEKFKEKHKEFKTRNIARKKQPKLIFLGSSNSSR